MATKSGLIAAVNGFLTALITQAKVRSAALETINELYPTKLADSSTDETYTTKNGSVITYGITFVKQGRSIRINGTYTNPSTTASLPSGTTVFTIDAGELRGDTSYYLGVNADWQPYIVRTVGVLLPSEARTFTLTINSDT